MGEGWAQRLLAWEWRGVQLVAEISRAKYYVRLPGREILAHAEVRAPGGRYRVDVGSFASMGLARAACERDAERRCRRDREERPAGDVRIAPNRRRPGKADKGRKMPAGNYRPRGTAVPVVVGDEG